ncbi:Hsp20/alpha crystallin family protein [Pedobacter sp.]|uniref:Hsp20/alpha crystallin family protein n=1 Tax=Pedobacter sp. TaxID=1411316 RepID=UPI0031DE3D82
MKKLTKSNGFPALKSMMEDFWHVDGFSNKPLLNAELLPAVNIKNKKDKYQIEVSTPGFKKKDFDVSVENGKLHISAETSSEAEESDEEFARKEFTTSSFSRSFNLPDDILQDEVKASYKDGLLRINIKKSGETKKSGKTIDID